MRFIYLFYITQLSSGLAHADRADKRRVTLEMLTWKSGKEDMAEALNERLANKDWGFRDCGVLGVGTERESSSTGVLNSLESMVRK